MYWAFDWLDLKMFESIVSVLPLIGFHCLGGPGFSKHTVKTLYNHNQDQNIILHNNKDILVGDKPFLLESGIKMASCQFKIF